MTGRLAGNGEGPTPLLVSETSAIAFERCVAGGGMALFPADTVYGLAVDPESAPAVRRLSELKRRDPAQPSAVMFFELQAALAALPELEPRAREAFAHLLPGPLTLIVSNPRERYPLACGDDPHRLGVRVPALGGGLESLTAIARPVLQSSANLHGGPDPRRLADVPEELRGAAEIVLDGGELPGAPSTVIDLSAYDSSGRFEVLREGALSFAEVERRLAGVGSND